MYVDRDHPHDKSERDYRVLNVRLNPTLHRTIQEIAAENGESLASTIRSMLRSSVEQVRK